MANQTHKLKLIKSSSPVHNFLAMARYLGIYSLGNPYPKEYDTWHIDAQLAFERGRHMAAILARHNINFKWKKTEKISSAFKRYPGLWDLVKEDCGPANTFWGIRR